MAERGLKGGPATRAAGTTGSWSQQLSDPGEQDVFSVVSGSLEFAQCITLQADLWNGRRVSSIRRGAPKGAFRTYQGIDRQRGSALPSGHARTSFGFDALIVWRTMMTVWFVPSAGWALGAALLLGLVEVVALVIIISVLAERYIFRAQQD